MSGAAVIGGKPILPVEFAQTMAGGKTRQGVSFGGVFARALLAVLLVLAGAILALRWLPPPTSAFMLRAEFAAWREGKPDFTLRQQWVGLSALPPAAGLAVVAAEDQSFVRHHGFNFQAMAQAFKRNRNSTRIRGGSTLTQQTAKNLFLSPHRTLLRKALEAGVTVLLELLWPKTRILEVYLNIAQFGDGIYGVDAASRAFFGKPASRLEPREAALLAAVLPNPLRLRVDKPSAYVLKRRDWILRQMHQLGDDYYPPELRPSR
jgi:monofunctional biosynthetic peptidoglycan transglycosylase